MDRVAEWQEIRRLYYTEGVAKKEIARRVGRDIKTIRRALDRDEPPVKRRSPRRGKMLDPYREQIRSWLRDESGIKATEIAKRLRPRTGPISGRTVRKYVAELRQDESREEGNGDVLRVVAHPPREGAPCTPADTVPVPEPDAEGRHDLDAPGYYLNRELTWLNFNFRVLNEAEDERTPLLERLKFVAIVANNLDEFSMKRIGGLKQQVGAGVVEPTVDGRTPEQQIEECLEVVRVLEGRLRAAYGEVIARLEGHDIRIVPYTELGTADRKHLRDYFLANIFPLLTPQATDPAHPFPFISNLSLNLLVTLRYPNDPATSLARVKVPVGAGMPRFVKLPDRAIHVPIETVLAHNLDLLFPGMEVESCSLFRVTRNANTEIDEETADDLLAMIETELRERKFAPIVRLEVASDMPQHHRNMLATELGLDEHTDVFEVEGMLGMRDFFEIAGKGETALHDAPHHPVDPPEFQTDKDMFQTIRDAGSILVHHPYQSYAASVERFLSEASNDPSVRAIKMTLYRTSEQSKAIEHLIQAARNGKQVAVVVELKARFDEAANIRWANRLEEVGIHVTYGVVGLKTHCKVVLVVRQDQEGLVRYTHIGTGNYHAGTARLYSDLGLLTCDAEIGHDLTQLFNYLTTGYKPSRKYRKLLVSPKSCKQSLLKKIRREAACHSEESPGLIQIKANALEDADVTRALYLAAQAGVRVDLVIRDTCRLRPGIQGLSENVRVVSIVGRFLEHTRVYYFRNGGDEEYYIGSADPMKRNLQSRVEVLVPVEAPRLRAQIRQLLDYQVSDERGAWEMRADGSYEQRGGDDAAGSQEHLIEWAEKRLKQATRLRKRKPRAIGQRNVR